MNILITGGAGFIGSHLVKRLLSEKHNIVVVDNLDPYYSVKDKLENIKEFKGNKNFEFIKADIADRNKIAKIFKTHKFDVVVHLAAKAGVRPSIEDPIGYFKTNVEGTLVLLEACKDIKLKNFIFISSSSVYGERSKVPFSENDRAENPISPYGLTKLSCEKLLKVYNNLYSIPVTALRLFTVYGPRQRPDLAIRKFIDKIYKGEVIEMYGNGSTMRDYTYVDDIVNGIVRCVYNPFDYEVINLGNSNPVKLKDMIHLLEEKLGRKAIVVDKPNQQGDVSRTYANIKKAKTLLDWQPNFTFEKGLSLMIEWYLSKYAKKD